MDDIRRRVRMFCDAFGLAMPVLQAPMAGACPASLAVAVAGAGGMGACGTVLHGPEQVGEWMEAFRAGCPSGAVQLNIWVPGSSGSGAGERDRLVADAAAFLGQFGAAGESGGRGGPPPYREQCEAMLTSRPTVISSIMGLFEPEYVRRLHAAGITWFACATTLEEALAAEEAGADAVVAQGMEAGGHRGSFDQEDAERTDIGLFALVPWFADHLRVPVVAAGGIGDGRGVAAALALGASAVQVGTALLRTPEAAIEAEWADALVGLGPDATLTTRAYSGRLARAVTTPFLEAWQRPDAPRPAPFPDQLGLIGRWRAGGAPGVDPTGYFAGQSAALASPEPAGDIVTRMWRDASALLGCW
ncbi:NAD(P)H-dependent flavin oxidoreductase [Streptomyces sp. NPDC002018]|uniref:NAD(P)H-dependent flavin oxidoreductase n=1 Tax=Streptomyces sp. NPDC002018 TaxID=3364629 RepID=UPI0036997ECF